MMASNLHIFLSVSIFLALIFTPTEADTVVEELFESDKSEAFLFEIDKLAAKIQSLESLVDKKIEELKSKDEMIAQKETEVAEKEKIIKEKVHDAWLPPWLAAHLIGFKSYAESHWKEHGKPAFEHIIQKKWVPSAREQWMLVRTNAKPHLQALTQKIREFFVQSKEKWVPAAREQWMLVGTNAKPHLQALTQKIREFFIQSKEKWVPAAREQWVLVRTNAEPHLQALIRKIREFFVQSKDKWVPAAWEQLVLVRTNVEPHLQALTQKIKDIFIRFKDALIAHMMKIKEVVDCHFQSTVLIKVQGIIEESLTKHKSSSTKEWVWFAASPLLALPIIILFKTVRNLFLKAKRPTRNPNQPRRNSRRAHPDK